MSNDTEKEISRRKFLKTSVGAAVMIGCFTKAELREALAQAKVAGKPLLTAPNINLHITRSLPTLHTHIAEFRHGPIAYLTAYFYIKPSQREVLAELFDVETINNLCGFLEKRAQDRKPFKVVITRRPPQLAGSDSSDLQSRVAYASFSFEKRADVKYRYDQKSGHQVEVSAGGSC